MTQLINFGKMVQIKTCEDLEKATSLNNLCFLKIGAP